MRVSWRRAATFVVAGLAALTVDPGGDFRGNARDDTITVRGNYRSSGSAQATAAASSAPSSTVVTNCVPMEEYGRLRCYSTDLSDPNGYITARTVTPGEETPGAAELAAAVVSELRRLPLVSGGIVVQPSRGWTLVNVETIVLTDPAPQEFAVTLLGVPLVVRAEPVRYTWDFGDGSPALVTTEPGARWPEPTVTHVYRSVGERTITLTTEWSGVFRIQSSDPWQPVTGTAVTVESAPPLEVRQARNVLVVRGSG